MDFNDWLSSYWEMTMQAWLIFIPKLVLGLIIYRLLANGLIEMNSTVGRMTFSRVLGRYSGWVGIGSLVGTVAIIGSLGFIEVAGNDTYFEWVSWHLIWLIAVGWLALKCLHQRLRPQPTPGIQIGCDCGLGGSRWLLNRRGRLGVFGQIIYGGLYSLACLIASLVYVDEIQLWF